MAYAQLKFEVENTSSAAVIEKPRFKVLEGGLSKKAPMLPAFLPEIRIANIPSKASNTHVAPAPKKRSDLPVALFAAAIALTVCLVSIATTHVAQAKLARDVENLPATEYIVSTGDSLWSIAATYPIEGHSTSDVVSWILERNNLDTSLIIPGQSLFVPADAS